MGRRIGTAVLAAAALVYAGLIGIELVQQARHWTTLHRDRDFPSYYLAARRLLQGRDFYRGLQQDAAELGLADYFIDTAVTPPTFAITVAPLALVSYPVAWAVWQVLSLAALAGAMALIVREEGWRLSAAGRVRMAGAVVLFPPLGFHLLYAHTELFILLLLVGAWVLLRREREVPAGILLGLAGAIRIYPLFLLLYLGQRRARRGLLAGVGGGGSLVALAAVVAGPSSYLRYLEVLRSEVTTLYARAGNCSLWGTVHKMASLWPSGASSAPARDVLAVALSVGILLLTVWLARRPGNSPPSLDREYGLYVVAALLASPLSWIYYQVLLYLPLAFLLSRWPEHRPAGRVLLVAALVTALSPLLGAWPGWPAGAGVALNFFPTLTLVGVYAALAAASVEGSAPVAAGLR